jgi:uncharacterized protein YkwD
MALVSMRKSCSSVDAQRLHKPLNSRVARIAQAIGAVVVAISCVAAAATIPTVSVGSRTLVSVEPLLQSMRLGYVIHGSSLEIDGKPYPQPLVVYGGMDMADASQLARFLHLRVAKEHGVLVFSSPQPAADSSSAPPSAAELEQVRDRLLAALNQHRSVAGLDALRVNAIAQQAAQFQATDMARAGEMRHGDSFGRTPIQRYESFGGKTQWYGENVGWYGLDATSATSLWSAISRLDAQMMSEVAPDDGHRRTILSGRYDGVGFGAQNPAWLARLPSDSRR